MRRWQRLVSGRGAPLIGYTSDVEAEQQDVAVLHDVGLAFHPHLARFLGTLLAMASDEIVVGDGFAGNETTLEILVDHRRGLWCPGALVMVQARVSFGPQVK